MYDLYTNIHINAYTYIREKFGTISFCIIFWRQCCYYFIPFQTYLGRYILFFYLYFHKKKKNADFVTFFSANCKGKKAEAAAKFKNTLFYSSSSKTYFVVINKSCQIYSYANDM